jgi:hypothetical protein
MKYYWIASTKNYVIFADVKSFLLDFKVSLLIIFTIFLGHQNPGPADKYTKVTV